MERLRTATRPVVTLLFSLAVVIGFWAGKISADQFMPIASTVALWWFADRSNRGNGK